MPPLETSDLNQTAVYWAGPSAAGEYDDYGEPKIDSPIEIACRWEERIDEVSGPNGTPVLSSVRVAVDRDVTTGARMWLGLLDDYSATETKLVVLAFSKVPDIRGTTFRRLAYLGRASVTTPDLNT